MNYLPPELWDEVAFFLPETDALSFAQTSRNFNSLLIPRLLHAQCLDAPRTVSVDDYVTKSLVIPRNGGPLDPLRLLAISFDVKEVDDLRWHLYAGYKHTPQDVHKNHARLERILGRLERIKRAKISFETPNHFVFWYKSLAAGAISIEEWEEMVIKWKTTMSNILNILLSKGCDRIIVENGGYPSRIPHPDPSKQPPTHSIVELALPDEIFARARVSHLGIGGQMFFNPPCLTWTRSILQLSTLTRLVLCQITMEPAQWKDIFSLMSPILSGKLQHLSISACRYLPLSPLTNFVTSLKALRSLRLLGEVPRVTGNSDTQSYPLPELRSLHAPIDWVRFLCPRPKSTETDSKLTYVRMIPRDENGSVEGLLHYKDSYPIFSEAILSLDKHSVALKVMNDRDPLPSPPTHPRDQWHNGCTISLDLTTTTRDLTTRFITLPDVTLPNKITDAILSMDYDTLRGGSISAIGVDPYATSATLFQRNPSNYPAYEKINEIVIKKLNISSDRRDPTLNLSIISRYLALWKGVKIVRIEDIESGHDGEEEWEENMDGAVPVVNVDRMSDDEFYEARAEILESTNEVIWAKFSPKSAAVAREFAIKRSMVQLVRKNAPHVKKLFFRDGVVEC